MALSNVSSPATPSTATLWGDVKVAWPRYLRRGERRDEEGVVRGSGG